MTKGAKSKPKTKTGSKVAYKKGRDSRSGTFMGIQIADPTVKPRGTTVRKIRDAVATAAKRG